MPLAQKEGLVIAKQEQQLRHLVEVLMQINKILD